MAIDLEPTNKKEIEERDKERELFLEFHYALGGLLLQQKRYKSINRSFEYTNSEPPTYALFPQTMTDIFQNYFKFRASYDIEMTWISSKYPFPDLEGISADNIIRNWICKYISCLFIRQYTLNEYFVYESHVSVPNLPKNLNDQRAWLDNIEFFENQVSSILDDKNLLNELGFDYLDNLSDIWCENNKKIKPKDIFANTKKIIEESIKTAKYSQELSAKKTNNFESVVKKDISEFFSKMKGLIFSSETIKENFNTQQIGGLKQTIDRFAYCENTDISYGETDSLFSEMYTRNWAMSFSLIFYRMRSENFLLSEDDFFKGIDNLKLSKEKHVIISFGFHLDFYKNKIKGLTPDSYNEIPIFDFHTHHPILSQSVIILNKADLPSVEFKDSTTVDKSKFDLQKPINEELFLYAKIIDYKNKPELQNELQQRFGDKDINESILAFIGINTEIRWKKEVDVIQIQMDSEFEQRGLVNKLNDIKSFNESSN